MAVILIMHIVILYLGYGWIGRMKGGSLHVIVCVSIHVSDVSLAAYCRISHAGGRLISHYRHLLKEANQDSFKSKVNTHLIFLSS